MRFDSFKAFITFLKVLGDLGYQVPFNDYEEDFKNKGFRLHIHFYKFKIIRVLDTLVISTSDDYGNYYSIRLERTRSLLRQQLKLMLKDYINEKTSIEVVNTSYKLIDLLSKEDKDNV